MSVEKEAHERLQEARHRKSAIAADLKEAQFFTAHWRPREVTSSSDLRKQARATDDDSPATALSIEVAADFVGHLMDTFMPRHMDWAARGKGMFVRQEDWETVRAQVARDDEEINAAIRASGFHAAAFTAFMPDLAIGTSGIWIDENPVSWQRPICWPVPMQELEVDVGPLGEIDYRAVVKHMTADQAAKFLGKGVSMPQGVDGKKRVTVALSFWQIPTDTGEPRWQHAVTVDKKLVLEEEMAGEGACPLTVFRFGPDGNSPWAAGPAIRSLPMLRVLDALTAATQDRAEYAISPPFTYPNDSVLNFEGGIQAGKGYPAMPGSGADIKPLYFEGNPDMGFYTLADLERQIRRLFYVDFPQQEGKTPPSASQWVDMLLEAQKRIGPPGEKFWREGPREVFQRFKFILEKRGLIQPIRVPGAPEGEVIGAEPYNPAVKAAAMQEVETAIRTLEVIYMAAPREAQLLIDGPATAVALQEKMGDTLIKMRNKQQMQQALGTLAQLAGGAALGGQE